MWGWGIGGGPGLLLVGGEQAVTTGGLPLVRGEQAVLGEEMGQRGPQRGAQKLCIQV